MFLGTCWLHLPLLWLYSQENALLLVTRYFMFRLYHIILVANSPEKEIFISKKFRKGCNLPGLGHTHFPDPVPVVRKNKVF